MWALRKRWWLLILLGWPGALWGSEPVQLSAEWCVAPYSESIESIRSSGCRWQNLSQPSGLLSQGQGVLWVRLTLINRAPADLERWLTLGNSRLQRVELYAPSTSSQWQTQRGGKALARNEQSDAMQKAAAFSLAVPAMTSTNFWLRVESDSLVALSLRLWTDKEIRFLRDRHDSLWLLGFGMGLALVALAVIFGFYAKESTYGLYALAFLGQLIFEVYYSDIVQRTLWPTEWPMPMGMVLGGVVAFVGGGTLLIRETLTTALASRLLMRMLILIGLCGFIGLLWSGSVSFAAGAHLWLFCTVVGSLMAMLVCARAWQQGSEVAGYLFVALLIWSGSVLFRIMCLYGLWPESETSSTWFMLFSLIWGVWFLSSLAVDSLRARREVVELRADASSQLAMFARISHELRTPLDTILGNAQLLLRQRDRPPEMVVLKTMLDSGRHLLGMVDELLDYARGLVGALKVEPAATRFDVWWSGLTRTGELLAVRNQNRFVSSFEGTPQVGSPLVLCFDAGRLRQVIDNLLVNASRYTQHGVITLGGSLEAQTRAPHQQFLSLYVEDTGCGIDPKDHDRIFEPFERLHRTTLAGGSGTGMGLAIARQLVGLMGGELTVLSALNRGARFTVKIPVTRSSEFVSDGVEMSLASARGYAGDRRRLLIVDDDDHSRDVLVRLLQSMGFEVSEASSGREAEAMLESGRQFDAVFTDQFMADGDGWWVLWAVHERQPDTPVLLISAALPHAPLGWSSSARFAATFLRPIKHVTVLRKLGDLLDLQWIFDSSPSSPLKESLIRPDTRSLSQLRELVAFGEVTAIREWAQALRDRDPLFEEFALAVEQAVMELDFGRLELLAAEL